MVVVPCPLGCPTTQFRKDATFHHQFTFSGDPEGSSHLILQIIMNN